MSIITRARNSTKRIAFKWLTTTPDGISGPLNLTGMTLSLILDNRKIESAPLAPAHTAVIAGTVTSAVDGQAYFPITLAVTGVIRTLFFEVWVVDANGETYPIEAGTLEIPGSLK